MLFSSFTDYETARARLFDIHRGLGVGGGGGGMHNKTKEHLHRRLV